MQSSETERPAFTLEMLDTHMAQLGQRLFSLFEEYREKQAQILWRDQLEYYRQVEERAKIFSLKTSHKRLFLDVISILKSLEALLPACEVMMDDINTFLEDDSVSTEDKEILTEKFYAFEEVHGDVQHGIGIYTEYYDSEDDEFRKEIHDVFAAHPDLVEWFTAHLMAARKAQALRDDPEEHYNQAYERLFSIIPEIRKWLVLIKEFNDDIATKRTYAESVEKYAEYCCKFIHMKAFCYELNDAIESMCDRLADPRITLEASTRGSVVDLLCKLSADSSNFLRNVIDLRDNMSVLAEDFAHHEQYLSPLLCKFMAPWVANRSDPLAESVAIWKENQESKNSSEDESPRTSFSAK